MKVSFIKMTFIAFVFAFTNVHAGIITVSNNTINAGRFTSLQTALDSANVDDTIYVHGSPTNYGSSTVLVKKRVTIIGAGHTSPGTQSGNGTYIQYLTIDSIPFTDPISGIKIIGCSIQNLSGASGDVINNVLIERCAIAYIDVKGKDWTIKNNTIYSLDNNYNTNTYVYNNFIQQEHKVNSPTVIFDHNVFHCNSNPVNTSSFALFTNNIFYYVNVATGCSNCTFNNNITTNSSSQVLPYGTNSGAGNFNNINPNFVSPSIPTSLNSGTVLGYDWHLKTISQGHNAATDGSDIGIYGGTYSMPNLSGVTTLPQITQMNIGNAIVPQGGTLNVNFKAKKQD